VRRLDGLTEMVMFVAVVALVGLACSQGWSVETVNGT
jgi:hypothetical protein